MAVHERVEGDAHIRFLVVDLCWDVVAGSSCKAAVREKRPRPLAGFSWSALIQAGHAEGMPVISRAQFFA